MARSSAWCVGFLLIATAMTMTTTGCATMVTGTKDQQVQIASTPDGAAVFVDDEPQATTPTRVMLDRKKPHRVRIELAGYQSYEGQIKPGANPWLWGDLAWIGMAPVAFGWDLISGASTTLKPLEMNVELTRQP